MKIFLPFLILFISSQMLFSQVFEYSEDRGHSNRINKVLNLGDTIWVVAENYHIGSVGVRGSFISAFDEEGNQLWEIGTDSDFMNEGIFDLILTNNGQIIVLGSHGIPCDVVESMPLVVSTFSPEGELLSEFIHDIAIHGFFTGMRSCMVNDQLVLSSVQLDLDSWDEEYKLFGFNGAGDSLLWTADWSDSEIHGLAKVNNNTAVFANNHLILVDDTGSRTDSLMYDSPPVDAVTLPNSKLLLLWPDGVYKLDNNLLLEQVIVIEEEESASEILLQNESVYIWFGDELRRYSLDFEWIESTTFDLLPYFTVTDIDININSLILVGFKSHEENLVSNGGFYRSGAIAIYSLSNDIQNFNMDVEIRHFQLESFSETQINENPPLFNFYADVSGYLVNSGDETVTSVNLNYLRDQGICGIDMQRLVLTNLNLLPGDSVLFEMNNLAKTQVYSSSGLGTVKFCVFASAPSGLYDRDETNDVGCDQSDFGVGIEENTSGFTSVYPNPARDYIVFEFSEPIKSGLLQIHNNNGQLISEKRIQSENYRLDVSAIPPGIYLARIFNDSGVSKAVRFSVVD